LQSKIAGDLFIERSCHIEHELRTIGHHRRMEDIAISVVTAVVATLAALTYGLMIWASAHRS
jgi:hypothetical protein